MVNFNLKLELYKSRLDFLEFTDLCGKCHTRPPDLFAPLLMLAFIRQCTTQ